MKENQKIQTNKKWGARLIIGFWVTALFALPGTAAESPPMSGIFGSAVIVYSEKTPAEQIAGTGITIAQSPAGSGTGGTQSDDRTGNEATDPTQKTGFGYRQALERVMNLVFVYLDSLEKRTDIGPADKKQKAIDFIRNVRWGPENKYYFWINDLDGKMILEPLYPRTEGTNVIKYKDLNSREIFVEFINNSLKNGQTFVDHNGLGYDANWDPRVSLVRLFGAWDWVVGTYVELDDIEAYEEPGELQFVIPLAPMDDQTPASSS